MNSLETEYSFLAPTWRLPTIATTSMYSRTYGTSYSSAPIDSGPDLTLWNNTRYNSRYIPSYVPLATTHRNYPLSTNHQTMMIPPQQQPPNYQTPAGGLPQSGPPSYQQTNNQYGNNTHSNNGLNVPMNYHPNNEYESYNNMPNYNQSQQQPGNRGLTYSTNGQNNPPAPPPPGQKRRVKIIDHNRHTPSTVVTDYPSSRQSHDSNSYHNPTSDLKNSKPSVSNQYHDHVDENRFGYTGNNTNIHEYLYGNSAPDPGSYSDAFKHHQRRLQEEKLNRKSVMSDYKSFAQNGGLGPTFGNANHQTHEDKIEIDKKKKNFSKTVRTINEQKIKEQKRTHNNNNEQPKSRPTPVPKHQRAREYAEKIEKPHNLKPVMRLRDPTSGNVIIRDASHHHHHHRHQRLTS